MTIFSIFNNNEFLRTIYDQIKDENTNSITDEDLQEAFSQAIKELTPELSRDLLSSYKKMAPQMFEEWRNEDKQFEDKIYSIWKEPIDLLEMLIILSFEAGTLFNQEHRKAAAESGDYLFEALTRLHSRACLLSREILFMLKGGYVSGAHARWRSLHETSVVALFLKKNEKDVPERYLLHEGIESFKAMKQYQQYHSRLGYQPHSNTKLKDIEDLKEQLCKRFGKCYANSYGWAAEALGKCNPYFSDLEKAVGLDHWRPFYKMASHAVHANPKSVYFDLGKPSSHDVLIAGPSVLGMADPGQSTALSLNQITSSLLSYRPTINSILVMKTFQELAA